MPATESHFEGQFPEVNHDALVLSKRDMCVLCFHNIYGEPYDIFGEWRHHALFFDS